MLLVIEYSLNDSAKESKSRARSKWQSLRATFLIILKILFQCLIRVVDIMHFPDSQRIFILNSPVESSTNGQSFEVVLSSLRLIKD